jgi:chaperonin cofactor prefoldin
LALAAEKSATFQRYGVNPNIDQILDEELNVTVNVGMTATDPGARLQQLILTTKEFTGIAASNPGFDLKALADEMYGKIGYRDSSRFWPTDGPTPEVAQLQQQVQALQQELDTQMGKIEAEGQVKLDLARLTAETEGNTTAAEIEYKKQSDLLEAQVKKADREVKALIAELQSKTQLQIAQVNSQDKSKDRFVGRLSTVEANDREDNKPGRQKVLQQRENKISAVADKVDQVATQLSEHEQARSESRKAIVEYLKVKGDEDIQALVGDIEQSESA